MIKKVRIQKKYLLSRDKVNIAKYTIFFLSSIILLLHSLYYLPFFSDDALISLQYAKRFLQGNGLTWTDGIPVEGYSNLLWILLISFFGLFKLDLIFAARFLNIALNIAVLFILIKIAEKIIEKKDFNYFGIIITTLFYSFSGIIAVWSIGGLEQPLLNFLIAISIFFMIDIFNKKNIDFYDTLKPGIFLGFMCLTRMDSLIFVFCFFVIFILCKFSKQNLFLSLGIILPAFILLAAQLIFRIIYYNDILPNPAYIKLGFDKMYFNYGIEYIKNGFKSILPVLVFVLFYAIFIFFNKKHKFFLTFLIMPVLFWLLYIIYIGGDILPAYRHFNVIIVILSIIFLIGHHEFNTKFKKRNNLLMYYINFFTFIFLFFYLYGQFNDKMMKKAKAEDWEWDGKEIALMLKKGFNEQKPTIVTSAAGCIPYWSDLPVIDSLGLNDYYIPRYSKRNILDRRLGHGYGDGYYILAREPDIIIFCGPWGSTGPCFTSEVQIYETKEFKENYTPVLFVKKNNKEKITSIMWLNKNSQKIGIVRNDEYIQIPAYFLGNNARMPVNFDEGNRIFKLKLTQGNSGFVSGVKIKAGNYTFKTKPEIQGIIEIDDTINIKKYKSSLQSNIQLVDSIYNLKLSPDKDNEISMVILNRRE